MRFFWPLRERSLSSDSEASTASQSSIASVQSFVFSDDDNDWTAPRVDPLADPLVDRPLGPPLSPPPFLLVTEAVVASWSGTVASATSTSAPVVDLPVDDDDSPLLPSWPTVAPATLDSDAPADADVQDSAGPMARPVAASPATAIETTTELAPLATLAPVYSVFVHNAQAFACKLCDHPPGDYNELQRHRSSRHRRDTFVDRFAGGCACGTAFPSRVAAARHARDCLTAPRAAATPPTLEVAGQVSALAPALSAAARAACPPSAPDPTLPPGPVAPARSPREQRAVSLAPVAPPRVAIVGDKRRRLNDVDDAVDDAVVDGDDAGAASGLRHAGPGVPISLPAASTEDVDEPLVAEELDEDSDREDAGRSPVGALDVDNMGTPNLGVHMSQTPLHPSSVLQPDASTAPPRTGVAPGPTADDPASNELPMHRSSVVPDARDSHVTDEQPPATSGRVRQPEEPARAPGAPSDPQQPQDIFATLCSVLARTVATMDSTTQLLAARRAPATGDRDETDAPANTDRAAPLKRNHPEAAPTVDRVTETARTPRRHTRWGPPPTAVTTASSTTRTRTRWGPRRQTSEVRAADPLDGYDALLLETARARRTMTRWGPRLQPPSSPTQAYDDELLREASARRATTRWGPRVRTTPTHPAAPTTQTTRPMTTPTLAPRAPPRSTPARRTAPAAESRPASAPQETGTLPDVDMTEDMDIGGDAEQERGDNSTPASATATPGNERSCGMPRTKNQRKRANRAARRRAVDAGRVPVPATSDGPQERDPSEPSPPATATSAEDGHGPNTPEPGWTLRFDGACRRNPAAGGAGAVLLSPSGAAHWTCAHYMPGQETNNTAEYTALLTGVESALQHGVTRLTIEGDSSLVIEQVRGRFHCKNKRLRLLRNKIQAVLRQIASVELRHIDRLANRQADGYANRALDQSRTTIECAVHARDDASCCHPELPLDRAPAQVPGRRSARTHDDDRGDDDYENPMDDEEALLAAAAQASRDGAVFPELGVEPDAFPVRQPRLRLRKLTDRDYDDAATKLSDAADRMAVRIENADDWQAGAGYITAIPCLIRHALACFSLPPPRPPAPPRRAQRPRRPPAPDAQALRLDDARADLTVNARAASDRLELRRLFATREKECVERIIRASDPETAQSPTTCPIASDELESYMAGVCAPRTHFDYDAAIGAPFRTALQQHSGGRTEADDTLRDPITADEVEEQIQRTKGDTSPGHDGIGYDTLKRFAVQLSPLLSSAFSFCWRHRRVPATWKLGNVRLLHKKGTTDDAGNWRPICLQPTLYKLYTGILARRLSGWLELNGRLPMSQKGYRAYNGCHENNFISTTLLDQVKRVHKRLYVVWYDLRDAFGSLPQQLMWRVLPDMGVDRHFVERCASLYDGASFTVTNASDGTTRPIRREVGVFQGCPLSPLLFIAALAPLLRRLEEVPGAGVQLADGVRPCSTAYADDLKLFADSAGAAMACHATVSAFLRWTGLRANPQKCAALGVTTNRSGNPTRDTTFAPTLDGDAIPTLTLDQSYNYLGVGDGFDHERLRLQLGPKLKELKREAVALMQSPLAPWQVIKALKVYIYPKAEYALRHVRVPQFQLNAFDSAIERGLRHLLRLPECTTSEFMYAPTSCGGLGLLPLTELHAALQAAHAFQMLHSKDPAIGAIAREQIVQICNVRHRLDPQHWTGDERRQEMIDAFFAGTLKNSPHAPAKDKSGDIASLWTDVRRNLLAWGLKLENRNDNGNTDRLQLRVPHHRKWLDHKTVLRHIKLHLKLRHYAEWKEKKAQGRTARAHGGLGAKFITSGGGLSDAEYRFAWQARLNVVDTNHFLQRIRRRGSATCRRQGCTRAETLPHVLNHCILDHIRPRHDTALDKIRAEIDAATRRNPGRVLSVNCTVPEFNGPALRPDIVLRDPATKIAVIVDLAISTEDDTHDNCSALGHSRDFKIAKYRPIAAALERVGWSVKVDALIYGSLGSVLRSNFAVYTELFGLLKRDAKRMDTDLSSHCIRHSRRIWRAHCAKAREHPQQSQAQAHQQQPGRASGSGGIAA